MRRSAPRASASRTDARRRGRARTRCRPRRSGGSASCVSGPAGARAGWRGRSAGRTRPSTRCCAAGAARAGPGPSGRRWSATSGPAPASCCTWTSSGSAVSSSQATRSPPTAPAARAGRASSTSTRSSTTARAWPTRRSTQTSAPPRSPPSPSALDWFLEQGIVCERLMTDNAFSYTQNRSFGPLLWRRAIRHIRTRPYTPRTNGKVERFHYTRCANGPTRSSTPQAKAVARRCHTGSTTTTSAAPTQRSATDRPATAFGTSSGPTSSPGPRGRLRHLGLASPRAATAGNRSGSSSRPPTSR